jgi:hypothetical protein
VLDAYIIDRIRREQEEARQIDPRLPLHIEPPDGIAPAERPPGSRPREERPRDWDERDRDYERDRDDRGTTVIDYSLRF